MERRILLFLLCCLMICSGTNLQGAETSSLTGAVGKTIYNQNQITSSDSAFLELLQKTAFDFFWKEANATNGLMKDRSTSGSPASIASMGFGLTAICIGIDHGWISRTDGGERVLRTLTTMWEKPQGRGNQGTIGYKGFFYHFLDMNSAYRVWNCELSSVDTAWLLAGMITAKEFFSKDNDQESQIRALADSIYYRVDWNWMRNNQPAVLMGWHPESGFLSASWRGYNEAMLLYILGLGSPTFPLPASCWGAWTAGYSWQTHYSTSYVNFPPLFGHQYSHCWIDFRNIQDNYMRWKGITYFENSRRATLAARAYCIDNPKKHKGYGENVWGLTACDGPKGYLARGAPPAWNDDGTIAPTAVGGSIPFAPEVCIPTLRYLYDTYKDKIWMKYGFRDAFNLNVNWWGPDVIGIDEGPIIVMIENYRSGRVWQLFMQNAAVQTGLKRAGFKSTVDVRQASDSTPAEFVLMRNFPNPYNESTTLSFHLDQSGSVKIMLYDVLGRERAILLDGYRTAGEHSLTIRDPTLESGAYFCRLIMNDRSIVHKMLVLP